MPRIYKPTEQARRYVASEDALREAGGRRVNVRLQPKAAKALDAYMEKHDLDQTAAINRALEKLK